MLLSADSSYLFVRRIAPEEDLNGYLHQLATARASPDPLITKYLWGMKADTRVWFVPRNVRAAVDAFWMSLPPLQQTLDDHTRTRVDVAFRAGEDERRLTEAYVEYGRPVAAVSRIKGRLKVCSECIEQDRQTHGYAYWHRLALIPGIDVCPRHASILLTLCGGCETKNFHTKRLPWQPSHRCACGGRLRAVQSFSTRHMEAELEIAKMTQQLLSGELNPHSEACSLKQTLRSYCVQTGYDGRTLDSTLREMLHDKLGAEYLAKICMDRNQRPLIDDINETASFFEPLHNIGAIYAVFGSWDAYREVAATVQETTRESERTLTVIGTSCKRDETVGEQAQERLYKFPKPLTRAEHRERFLALSEKKFTSIKEEARQWLQSILRENPSTTRKSLDKSKKNNRYFNFLKICDREYYEISIPNNSKISEADVEERVEHIRGRRDFMVKEFPWIRITSKILIENLPENTSRCLGAERIANALSVCRDTTESYHERLVPILCQWVRSMHPNSYYGDEEAYRSSEGKICVKRINRAKTLLLSLHQLATAHPCLFPGLNQSD